MEANKDETNTKKTITGPSLGYTDVFPKREMWKEIANDFDGKFKIVTSPGHVVENHKISIPHKKWTIEISVSDSQPLKFKSSFNANIDFTFIVSQSDLVGRILKRLGKKNVKTGWTKFDKHYLIESRQSDLVRTIITREIQDEFLKHNIYSLSHQYVKKTHTAEILSVIQRQPGDKALIIELIVMFKKLIDNLQKAGVIRE